MVDSVPIGDKGDISPAKSVPSEDVSSDQNSDQTFQDLVNKSSAKSTGKPTPMNALAPQGGMQTGKASPENLVANMQLVMGQMKNLGDALQTPNLKLNPRTRRLLDAKLKRAKDHIQYVSSKANVGDEKEDQESSSQGQRKIEKVQSSKDENQSAVEKLVGYVTDGQSQLESAMHNVSHMKMDPKNPGMMMEHIFGMQTKLYRAQVEVEFSSAVLQKAIDDLKTIMSVQL